MIKQIYGIRTVKEARDAVLAGADYIGIVPGLFGNAPSRITIEESIAIFDEIDGKAKKVALTLSDNLEEIIKMVEAVNPQVLHLAAPNFKASKEFVLEIKKQFPNLLIMHAVGVSDSNGKEAVKLAVELSKYCDYLLLDSASEGQGFVGATGATHDLKIDAEIVEKASCKVIIAGGLGPCNVADAIRATRPYGVDSLTKTNLYLENGERTKDFDKMKAFCKNADEALDD